MDTIIYTKGVGIFTNYTSKMFARGGLIDEYPENRSKLCDVLTTSEYVTEFDISPIEGSSYKIAWSGKTDGEMDVTVEGNKLLRSRSYFDADDDSGYQEMHWINPDAVVFYTAYDGTSFREEVPSYAV